MKDIKQVIAKNITELRLAHSMTQLELANVLNYSDKSISKWERGDSVPDVCVLKEIADLFGVTLDYLVSEEHFADAKKGFARSIQNHNRGFITGMSIIFVWLIATLSFVIIDIALPNTINHWLSFVYAVPVSMIVWLIFNSIWFDAHKNYLIISFLMWSVLGALYLTFLPFGFNIWLIFVLGIPGQILIFMWSRLKYNRK